MVRSCDGYVIIKISTLEETVYKLFTCNFGGYLDSDSWRMNSGIVFIEKDDTWDGGGEFYLVHGHSGSVYRVHSSQYQKLTSYCQNKLNEILGTAEDTYTIEIISIEDYLK